MGEPVSYSLRDRVAVLDMDDGKVNVMSPAMLRALHAGFDRAAAEADFVVLAGRPGIFSAGFDLNVFARGAAEDIHEMMSLGATLALKVLSFPRPVVAACTGHAFPMGAFLMLGSDVRIGAEGPFRMGLNEVAIGISPPGFAVELARQRLAPAWFQRTCLTGELFSQQDALTAGLLDRVVVPEAVRDTALAVVEQLRGVHLESHALAKLRVRGPAIAAVRSAIDQEIRIEAYRSRVAMRAAA